MRCSGISWEACRHKKAQFYWAWLGCCDCLEKSETSFNVLYLLPHLFDQNFEIDGNLGHFPIGGF